MRKTAALVASFLMLLLTGCSIGSTVEELMRPPQLAEEQVDLYNALISEVGSSVKLKYPRSGSYRAPFVMYDLDSDGVQEAIVFYENKAAGATESIINVKILDKNGESWTAVKSFECLGTDIDVVDFAVGSYGIDIVIGYYKGLAEKNLLMMRYDSSNSIVIKYETAYTKVLLYDTVKNGPKDVYIFNNNAISEISNLHVISAKADGYSETGPVQMAKDTVDISNIATYRSGEKSYLYVDVLKPNNKLSTEIIEVSDSLKNLTYSAENPALQKSQRQSGIYSSDIDSDGIIEIPVEAALPGYENIGAENALTATQWQVFENGSFVRKYYSYCDINSGYIFFFPERWLGQVTVKLDESTKETLFCKNDGDLELMRIKAVSKDSSEEIAADYKEFTANEHTRYLVKISDTADALAPTEAEITYGLLLQNK